LRSFDFFIPNMDILNVSELAFEIAGTAKYDEGRGSWISENL
jgi:hypothetical protein